MFLWDHTIIRAIRVDSKQPGDGKLFMFLKKFDCIQIIWIL